MKRSRTRWVAPGTSLGAVVCTLTVFIAAPASAQSPGPSAADGAWGRITGRVVNEQTAEPVAGAQVYIPGTNRGTLTGVDGRYMLLNVMPGVTDVAVQMLGYATKTVTHVEVDEGGVAVLDIAMEPAAIELAEIRVSAARERGSSAFLMDERRSADAVVDAVGSTDIARSGDSDAADVAARMSGLTVTDGKYVHVRGLGPRYSQTSLNGSPLPSPEPEKEVVPLDLFPASFLQSIKAQKTYTPDLPGDFSGASMEITTVDFPSRLLFQVGLGTSMNTNSQFRDGFLTYPGGDLDFLGVDDGTRALPSTVTRLLGGMSGERVPSTPAVREQLGQAFPRTFTPSTTTTPMNRSLNVSLGNRVGLLGKDLGWLFAFTYDDSYTIRDNDLERKYRANSFDPALTDPTPNVEYTFDRGTHSVSWGTIANASILLSPFNKIALKTTYNRNADDEARVFTGANREDLGGEVRDDRLRFVSRELAWGQLSGEHRLMWDSRLTWRLTGARATRDEPMLREALYLRGFGADPGDPYYLENVGESGRYFFSDLTDDDLSTGVDWKVPFDVWSGLQGSIKLGGAWRQRTRDFAARRFNWQFWGGVTSDLDSALDSSGAVVGFVNGPQEFALSDVVEPGDQYGVNDRRYAGYAMAELPLTDRLRVVVGARAEQYRLALDSRGERLADLDQMDLLPAANVIYALNDQMNLRAAYSRTLDRPEFRELAPFQFTEATSLRQLFGNPDLKVTRIQNVDLRWEWFPRAGDVVSVSAFYKHLQDPIEQVYIAAASSAFSFQNATWGRILGTELDARTSLGALTEGLEDFSAQANLSLIHSEVVVEERGIFQPTNLHRPLEGQSPFVANAGLVYAPVRGSTELGLYYNIFGKRIEAAGGSGLPDIYEMPRHSLDFTFKRQLGNGMRLRFKASNLLDAAYRFEQSANGVTLLQRRYDVGRTFSLGLTYRMR